MDGYNIPMGIVYIPGDNPALQAIPPNLVNAACIASAGYLAAPASTGLNGNSSNSTYPIPLEPKIDNAAAMSWCPWDLQKTPPDKPGDGVYPYPDDTIQRPTFDPCFSACAKNNAPSDCCTGAYDQPNLCPRNDFAKASNAICPDAYGYPFDDQTSTFIIPTGGGWEIVFCPEGRSTNILQVLGDQMRTLASAGKVTKDIIETAMNETYIDEMTSKSAANEGLSEKAKLGSWGALVGMLVWGIWLC